MNYEYFISRLNKKEIVEVKKYAETRYFIFIRPLRDDEEFTIEVGFCKALGRNSLPYLWHKFGYTDKVLDDYIIINTYCTSKDGFCTNYHNPQINDMHKINFNYLLETNEENLKILVDKAIEMYKKNIKFLKDEEVL